MHSNGDEIADGDGCHSREKLFEHPKARKINHCNEAADDAKPDDGTDHFLPIREKLNIAQRFAVSRVPVNYPKLIGRCGGFILEYARSPKHSPNFARWTSVRAFAISHRMTN